MVQQGEQLWWKITPLKFCLLLQLGCHSWPPVGSGHWVCKSPASWNLCYGRANDDSWHWHCVLGAWWFKRAFVCIGPNWGKPKWKTQFWILVQTLCAVLHAHSETMTSSAQCCQKGAKSFPKLHHLSHDFKKWWNGGHLSTECFGPICPNLPQMGTKSK